MSFFIILSYLPYALVSAFTPGPNNLLALYAVSRDGWKQGRRVLFGICAGFFAVMVLCALFCYELDRYLPALSNILKYVGAAYILWLAIHVARSKPDEAEGHSSSFWQGFLLQFVNVKVILYAITVYTGYVLPVESQLSVLLVHSLCLTLIGAMGFSTWAVAGSFLQQVLRKHFRLFNYTMGAVLALCAVSLLL